MVQGVFSLSFDDAEFAAPLRAGALRQFIGGEENRLVELAFRESIGPQPRFSPLVFVGPSGTGKSLLVRGLANRWQRRGAGNAVAAMSGADFARGYANAVETDSLAEFRDKLRTTRRLVIEDLQELAGKDAAQQELVTLLDHLHSRGALLLATLPLLPEELRGFCAALASRLAGGLTVPVAPPGEAARKEILRRLARLHSLDLSAETCQLLTGGPQPAFATAPELQHALSQLMLLAEEQAQPISADLARTLVGTEVVAEPTLKVICQATAKHFQVKGADLRSASRRQTIARARGLAMLLSRRLTKNSLEEIGKHFGNRDHTTVIHACRTTEERLRKDRTLQQDYDQLHKQLAP